MNKFKIINKWKKEGLIKNEQLEELFSGLKKEILKDDYNGENKFLQTVNLVIQISSLEHQKNNANPNVSSIDLG